MERSTFLTIKYIRPIIIIINLMVYYSEMPSYNSNNKDLKLNVNVNEFRFAKKKKYILFSLVCMFC